jgi:peptidoglycan L-alanyl-D-glutamate endopeptidase CwlK
MARDIKQLHPRLQAKVEELKALCEKEGLNIGIGECFRSVAEQDKLYAQGRTTPGSIVTNAKGSTYSSQHQWGIAFDFFKNVKGHEYDDIAFFNKVGALAKSIGLAWGGDWKNPVDKPHLYLGDWGSTTTKLKNQYGTFEKFKATWNVTEQKVEEKKEVYKLTTLKKGSKGNDVTIFETIMKKMGYYTGAIDTSFGSGCVSACNKFQTKYPECGTNGKPDETWGKKCWKKALSLLDV